MIVAKFDVKLVTILRLMQEDQTGFNFSRHSDILEPFDQDIDVNHQDAEKVLNEIRLKNINNVVIAYLNVNNAVISDLNVNSNRNKYDSFKVLIVGNVDIVILSETKLDDSFPTCQFLIEGFKEHLG